MLQLLHCEPPYNHCIGVFVLDKLTNATEPPPGNANPPGNGNNNPGGTPPGGGGVATRRELDDTGAPALLKYAEERLLQEGGDETLAEVGE